MLTVSMGEHWCVICKYHAACCFPLLYRCWTVCGVHVYVRISEAVVVNVHVHVVVIHVHVHEQVGSLRYVACSTESQLVSI